MQVDLIGCKLIAENLSFGRAPSAGAEKPRRAVLEGVSFGVRKGEVFGIIGPSGAGKTTLLRLLNGLESPDRGRILIDGVDAAEGDVLALRRRVGMVFQSPALFPGRVSDNVSFPLALGGCPRGEQKCLGRAALAQVGLAEDFWERGAAELSQGEQQRVSIARALVNGPEVLLMDEPTSALDPTSSARILSVVRSLNRESGVTIVFVTHLMQQARAVCDRALVLIEGRSIEEGPVPALFDAPANELTRRFISGELEPGEGGSSGAPTACGPGRGDVG
jgi:ABC-type methionine transport system ATPase subunit